MGKITTQVDLTKKCQQCQEVKCSILIRLLRRQILLQKARSMKFRMLEQPWWKLEKDKALRRGRNLLSLGAVSIVEEAWNWITKNKKKLLILKSNQIWEPTWWKMSNSRKLLESHQSHPELHQESRVRFRQRKLQWNPIFQSKVEIRWIQMDLYHLPQKVTV